MIVLKNPTFIDWQSHEFINKHVLIDQKSDSIVLADDLPEYAQIEKLIDCTGKYVIKSFGCAHTHSYSSLTKGNPSPCCNSLNYYDTLRHYWWELDKVLSKEMIEYSALVSAIEFAKRGSTFIIDHHSSPYLTEGALETIAQAFDKVGVGHLLCHEVSDRNGTSVAQKQLEESDDYLANRQGLVGLHASFTLTNKTLQKAVDLAVKHNTGLHVHVAEDLYDQDHCYDIHNMRVVERFKAYGVLDQTASILVNCLYLTQDERRILQNSNSYIVQNTESCLNKNESHFNSCLIGEHVMLGTDGIHFNMLRALKNSYYLGQYSETVTVDEAAGRLLNINHYTKQNGFKGYNDNSLLIVDYKPSTEFNQQNYHEHLVSCIESINIQHVIANGRLIVEDRKLVGVDEDLIKKEAQKMSNTLWSAMP